MSLYSTTEELCIAQFIDINTLKYIKKTACNLHSYSVNVQEHKGNATNIYVAGFCIWIVLQRQIVCAPQFRFDLA